VSAVVIDSGEGVNMKEPHVLRGIGYGLALVVAGLWVSACAQSQAKKPDVEYVPTPHKVVGEMLQLLAVKPTDIVYDLGCGMDEWSSPPPSAIKLAVWGSISTPNASGRAAPMPVGPV
jgi:hypothetical protein